MSKDKNIHSNIPVIQVISIKDQPDGSALMTYEINDASIEFVKKELGKEKVSKKDINNWLLGVIRKAVNEEDGYKFEKLKEKDKKEKDKRKK